MTLIRQIEGEAEDLKAQVAEKEAELSKYKEKLNVQRETVYSHFAHNQFAL
jgi:uncharacterized membrane-anchored protein YhcB (DUF1043 family)